MEVKEEYVRSQSHELGNKYKRKESTESLGSKEGEGTTCKDELA